MAQVTVTIDGKAYRMACEEGQEDHLSELAAKFDQYIGHLRGQFGEIGDLRLTVMAGIMVMDELSEVERRMTSLEAEVEKLKNGRAATLSDQARSEEAVAAALCDVTTQIHGIVARLNGRPTPSN